MCVLLSIAGCHKGLFWSTVATLVTNAIVKITNAFLQCVTRCRDSRMAKSIEQGRDDHMKQLGIQPPTGIFLHIYAYSEKRYVGGLYT